MTGLDLNYIEELIHSAQQHDANAFAEFYAATYQKQYAFLLERLPDAFQAQEVLQKTYTMALQEISRIQDAALVIPWLTMLMIRCCFRHEGITMNHRVSVDDTDYTVSRIISLPMTEAVTILLHDVCDIGMKDIASILEIGLGDAKRYRIKGSRRLHGLEIEV